MQRIKCDYKDETLLKRAKDCIDMLPKWKHDKDMFQKITVALHEYLGRYYERVNDNFYNGKYN